MKVTGSSLEELFYAQDQKCCYTGQALTLENMQLDHVIPLSRNGYHEMENVCWTTKRINRMKGTMTEREFVEVCEMVACHCAKKNATIGVRAC